MTQVMMQQMKIINVGLMVMILDLLESMTRIEPKNVKNVMRCITIGGHGIKVVKIQPVQKQNAMN
jgi:hypothetical protein